MIRRNSGIRRASAGFTLIEVLVVVAIIALLIAVLLPALSKARKQARRTVCASNLHQIAIGLLTYRETYREFPNQAMINVNASGQGQAFGLLTVGTHRTLGKFLKTGFKTGQSADDVRAGGLWYCPEVDDSDRFGDEVGQGGVDPGADPYVHTTYMYLGRLNDATNDPAVCQSSMGDPANCNPRADIRRERRLYVTKEPDAQRILAADMMMYWGNVRRWRINHGPAYGPASSFGRVPVEGMNQGFGDGHVEWKIGGKFPQVFSSDISAEANRDRARTSNLYRDGDMWWW